MKEKANTKHHEILATELDNVLSADNAKGSGCKSGPFLISGSVESSVQKYSESRLQ